MSKRLSEETIRQRMIEWRNYRRLYPELRRKYEEVKEENRQLRKTVAEQQALIEKLLLRVEQLETMVFGRKKSSTDTHEDGAGGAAPPVERRPRPPSSFRRATPAQEEVTARRTFPIDHCPDCGHVLRKKATVIRFVEDIPRPRKTVEEQSVERGLCPHCRTTHAAVPIAPQR